MTVVRSVFDDYWAAVTSGDAQAAASVLVHEYQSGAGLADMLDMVCFAQAEVGRLWAANEWNVAQEHRATSVGEEVIAALSAQLDPPAADGKTVVLTCTDGEWHSLPSKVLSAALRAAGHRVTYLGASVPARQLSQLVHELGPDVIAISCALPTRLPDARQMIETAREAGVPALVGGRGFGSDGRWASPLGANAWAPDARGAISILGGDELPAFATPAPPLRQPDDAIGFLRARAAEIVAASMSRMTAGLADVASYDSTQIDRTREDVHHILDFLSAALYVDDVVLFTDFVTWLDELLVARGVPTATLRRGLDVIAEVIASERGPYDRALDFLRTGANLLG